MDGTRGGEGAVQAEGAAILPNLTPLRGLAALMVVFLHYNGFVASVVMTKTSPIVGKLYLMVDLFFVLSGFVMTHVYGERFQAGVDRRGLAGFISARFARLYPLHLATLLASLALGYWAYATHAVTAATRVIFDPAAIPSQFLLLQGLGPQHEATWDTPSWSISVEWWTYLLFPFLVWALARGGRCGRWMLAALILGGYLAVILYFEPHFWAQRWAQFHLSPGTPYPVHSLDVVTGPGAMLRCVCGFALGMLLYGLFRSGWGRRWLGSGVVLVIMGASLLGLWQVQRLPDVAAVGLMGLIILGAAHNRDGVGRVLSCGPLQHLGTISYSLYLVHLPLIFGFWILRHALVSPDPLAYATVGYHLPKAQAWGGLVLFYVLSISLASWTYRFIERPGRAYLRRRLRPGAKGGAGDQYIA